MLQHAPPGLADDGEGLGQQVVERLAAGDALLELAVFALQLVVGERLDARLEVVDLGDNRAAEPLQFAVVLGAENFGEKLTNHVRRTADGVSADYTARRRLGRARRDLQDAASTSRCHGSRRRRQRR